MHAPSVDAFYISIEKQIKLADLYIGTRHLASIIRMCRLKPYDITRKLNRHARIVRYRKWFDEFGCSVNLITRRHAKIIPNDLSIDRKRIVCTDLYHGLSLSQTVKISKLIYIYWGKEEGTREPCGIITLLGLDNYLRSFMYSHGELSKVSPLLIGMRNLRQLCDHMNIRLFKKIKKPDETYLPCGEAEVLISPMPAPKLFWRGMKRREELYMLLTNGGMN